MRMKKNSAARPLVWHWLQYPPWHNPMFMTTARSTDRSTPGPSISVFRLATASTLTSETSINEISFYAWLEPGDSMTSVELQIGSAPFSNSLEDVNVNLTQSDCFSNNFGFNVCHEPGNWLDQPAPPGKLLAAPYQRRHRGGQSSLLG